MGMEDDRRLHKRQEESLAKAILISPPVTVSRRNFLNKNGKYWGFEWMAARSETVVRTKFPQSSPSSELMRVRLSLVSALNIEL
jgi:hypothetical protein